MKNWVVSVAALGGLLVATAESWGFGCCSSSHYCAPSCVSYQHVQVQRTVRVPQWVTQKQTVTVCEYQVQPRTQTVTRYRSVPVVREVPYEYTVAVPQQRVEKQTYHVSVPYTEKVEQVYTVLVPKVVQKQGVRQLCRWVPTVQKAYRCVDQGYWEDQVCNYTVCTGGGCCSAPCYQTVCSTHKVWRSNPVQVAYDVTVNRPEYYQENYTYNVTITEPVQQKRVIDVTRYRTEAQVRDVTYTVCNYERRTASRQVTEYQQQAYQDTVTYNVSVPVHSQREVDVRVCNWVDQVVTQTVCVPVYTQPSCDYGHGHHGHDHGHHGHHGHQGHGCGY